MGIQDRDYMKRRRDDNDDDREFSGAGSKVAGRLSAFFEKHPRLGIWLAVVLLGLLLAALIMARLAQE